ncbi:MAG: Hydroxypyruvate reductase [Candidatus Binatus sp.]|nr:Hydroxypyruvate reductase [Candidatus Binatus sp.]
MVSAHSESARADLKKIFAAALAAVEPSRLVAHAMEGAIAGSEQVPSLIANSSRIFLVAIGKASAAMAREIENRLGDRLVDAITIVPKKSKASSPTQSRNSKVRVMPGAHPVPDETSLAAANAVCAMLKSVTRDDLVIVALSGGASAMCTMPAAEVPFPDKFAINTALLRAGASIREINTVRKHLSALKGGRLLRLCKGARVLGLVLSDVIGNDLATIASGLTVADPTTYSDAIAILKRRNIWGRAPEPVRIFLERAAAGEIEETLKNGDPALELVTNVIIGDNQSALDGARRAAEQLGYQVSQIKEVRGEADEVGRALAKHLATISDQRVCVIAGGEPVVTVRGNGRGGRAQQCALAMGIELASIARSRRIEALFAGTDGIDGPTDAAGAFVNPWTVAHGEQGGASATVALNRNDAYNFMVAADSLLITGRTGTNVSDVFIGLVNF